MIIKSNSVIKVKSNIEEKTPDIIIDPEEASRVLKEAKEKAELIISNANSEAQKIKTDAEIEINQYKSKRHEELDKEIEAIISQSEKKAYEDGYGAGFEKGKEDGLIEARNECDALLNEAEKIRDDNNEIRSKLLKSLEAEIIDLIQAIFEKIFRKLTEEDVDLIVSLVDRGIENLDMADKLTIITSRVDYDYLDLKKDEILAKASFVNELDLKYDSDMERGDLILETSKGSIDVSLAKQLIELKYYLREIFESEE